MEETLGGSSCLKIDHMHGSKEQESGSKLTYKRLIYSHINFPRGDDVSPRSMFCL